MSSIEGGEPAAEVPLVRRVDRKLEAAGAKEVLRALVRSIAVPPSAPLDQALRILDERFARGEIDVDEYNHRRELLALARLGSVGAANALPTAIRPHGRQCVPRGAG